MVEKGLLQRLRDVLDKPFETVTYTEAVKLLQASGKDFEYPVSWGTDLQSEHERWVVFWVFLGPPLLQTPAAAACRTSVCGTCARASDFVSFPSSLCLSPPPSTGCCCRKC